MSKYKYEDMVWVYVDPRSLVDYSELPVFECEVREIETVKVSSYGEDKPDSIRYTLSLGWDDLYRKESEVFSSKVEAIKFGLANYKASIESLENKLETYKHVYTLMEQEVVC